MASFNSVTYGVRKVGDLLTKFGRALIVTEKDDSKIDFDDIPDGALRVNPENGDLHVKLRNQPGWHSPKWAKDYFERIVTIPANGDYEFPIPTVVSYELFVKNTCDDVLKDKFIAPDGVLVYARVNDKLVVHNFRNEQVEVLGRFYRYDHLKNFTNSKEDKNP